MKDLKTYIAEAIKPPRLSAKNKHLWMHPTEEEVMKWLKENCNIEGKVEIVDGKINVGGDIGIRDEVEFLPYPFGEVTGFFSCFKCKKLKSLKNCPIKVGDFFICSRCNNLTSLEGAPEEVGGHFHCYSCKNLTSLEGAPKEVRLNFYCYDCGKKFTEADVQKVSKVKGLIIV